MTRLYQNSFNNLIDYCESETFQGYDPYDTLNSPFNFTVFGKWGPAIAIQIQKRNPVNLRPLLGIQKGYNPKGMGLFLKAYALFFQKTGDKKYLEKAAWLFDWLITNYTTGYAGKCWGYNFDWANPDGYLPAYTPSVVVTSFVADGIYEYYKISANPLAKEALLSAADYINDNIPVTKLPQGLSFAYTHLSQGCCYNASLLAAEILARADAINNHARWETTINQAIDFVLSKQKPGGEWWYSYNADNGKERKQIDFHQGFVLVSLYNLNNLLRNRRKDINSAIEKGLKYYRKCQFQDNGQSLWRIPKKWPVEIHNQAQGIITFSLLKQYNASYAEFAKTIAGWTIHNMQDEAGFFYYRKYPFFSNRIPFIRWSQAWMMLALAVLNTNE